MTQPPEDPTPPPPGDQTPPPSYEQQWPVQPAPGAPWPQYGSPYEQPQAPKSGTNGFAIAALIFGIIPICFLGLIFGIVALVQTGKSGQKGKGLAIAGIVLNVIWLVAGVTIAVVSSLDNADRDSTGTITKSGKVSVFDLKVGDCFNGLDNVKMGDTIFTLDGVPCSKLHQGEVYAEAPINEASYPGPESLQRSGETPCKDKLQQVAPKHYANRDVGVIWIYPEKDAWSRGDHHYSCIAISVGRSTGSITD
ncbi:DUF4190 domain-containing protein [Nocardioides marmorisolisilvae]|uniref:DUF4190 domain-containing protein n=1 Tax=Nocardioides marmorisolisilvae TaxID=1542737 RepID=A0A3N0DIE5_9ACTN|nr:DUF4190 domain-containing protein [Nocardioides marmorisolisilvae]RNL75462.1 DUF4190 domain-containing protein [Nocardioides marmorisolisilvae]